MTKEQLQAEIIAKYTKLISVYEDYIIGGNTEGYNYRYDFEEPANKLLKEIFHLKQQLAECQEVKELSETEKLAQSVNPYDGRAILRKRNK